MFKRTRGSKLYSKRFSEAEINADLSTVDLNSSSLPNVQLKVTPIKRVRPPLPTRVLENTVTSNFLKRDSLQMASFSLMQLGND